MNALLPSLLAISPAIDGSYDYDRVMNPLGCPAQFQYHYRLPSSQSACLRGPLQLQFVVGSACYCAWDQFEEWGVCKLIQEQCTSCIAMMRNTGERIELKVSV